MMDACCVRLAANETDSGLRWSELLWERALWLGWAGALATRAGATLARATLASLGSALLLFLLVGRGGGGRWLTAGHRLGQLASLSVGLEGQTGRAALETRIAADAQPISDARFLNVDCAIWRVFANCCSKPPRETEIIRLVSVSERPQLQNPITQ